MYIKFNKYNTRPFLKILEKISKDPKYYNNTFFFHNLISNIICQFIERFNKLFDKKEHPYLSREKLIPYKETLSKLVTLMRDTMRNKIMLKNNNKRHIDKNEEIKDEYTRLCFTIDMVVGNAFIKVLRRLILSFLKTRYPAKDEHKLQYITFVKQKGDLMLKKVEEYIEPDYENSDPSELTRKLVSIHGKYELDDEFSNDDENDLFKYIIDVIRNNGFEEISENEPLIRHLEKNFVPYFKDYYRICITKLLNVIKSYENYIMNQYINLEILEKLLDNLVNFNPNNENEIDRIAIL